MQDEWKSEELWVTDDVPLQVCAFYFTPLLRIATLRHSIRLKINSPYKRNWFIEMLFVGLRHEQMALQQDSFKGFWTL